MTIIKGGIRAVRTVISYSNKPKIPKVHITPITTTQNDIKVALYDRKKKKKIIGLTDEQRAQWARDYFNANFATTAEFFVDDEPYNPVATTIPSANTPTTILANANTATVNINQIHLYRIEVHCLRVCPRLLI